MRVLILGFLATSILAGAAQATERRFDLICNALVGEGVQTLPTKGARYKIDLSRKQACVPWTYDTPPKCKVRPIKVAGRWIDLSYRFEDGDERYEMYRVYDMESGWMHQILRLVGEPGAPFGDAVCAKAPFTGFEPRWTPSTTAPAEATRR